MVEKFPFTVMTKPIGARCNINCSYCYYLEKQRLYPAEKKFRMSPEVLERYIRALITTSTEAGMRDVTFAWQGGEPTMLGVRYFERVVALQERYRPEGVTIRNALQTNGMLLDEGWGRFLARHRFLVGISIDGPKKVHDRYRHDRAGRGSFEAVMRGLEVLQNHKVEHNALCVVHRHNAAKGHEIYRFLTGLGLDYLQFIPIVERSSDGEALTGAPQMGEEPGATVTPWSVAPRAYGKFLCDVFDTWFKRDIGKVFVQHFDVQLGLWLGGPPSICVFAETCGNGLALEHNGDLYACDHYVYPDFRLGNIMQTPMADLVWSDRQAAFGQDKMDSLTRQCQSCTHRFACNGGCPKHRFAISRDGEAGHNYLCEAFQIFHHHAGPRLTKMARLVKLGRPAAEVNDIAERSVARSRNGPAPAFSEIDASVRSDPKVLSPGEVQFRGSVG